MGPFKFVVSSQISQEEVSGREATISKLERTETRRHAKAQRLHLYSRRPQMVPSAPAIQP